jgi:hypothetical protein
MNKYLSDRENTNNLLSLSFVLINVRANITNMVSGPLIDEP